MATRDRVAAALNFLTGEGVEYSPDSCDDKSIEALILDYFDGSGNDEGSGSDSEESLDESDRNNEGNTQLYKDGPLVDDNEEDEAVFNKGLIEQVEYDCESMEYANSPTSTEIPLDTTSSSLLPECTAQPPNDHEPVTSPVPSSVTHVDCTHTSSSASIQQTEEEQSTEISRCRDFVSNTCGCKMADGKPCSGLFSLEQYVESRAQSSLLTREQLDLVLMGSILSLVNDCDKVAGRHQAKRQRITVAFMHRGYHLCRATYSFLYGVSKHRIQNIKEHVLKNGLITRTHRNTKRSPHHALTFGTILNVLKFIVNYGEQNAILLPGRIPQFKRDDVKVVPCSDSKKKVWRKYLECCATTRAKELGMQPVAYRTFCRYWQLQLGYIVIGKPRSDLCWTCQQNSQAMMKMANMADKDKEKIISEAKDHMDAVSKERKFYRETCKASRDNMKSIYSTASGSFAPPPPRSATSPNSIDTTIHYSFDMAQQVHYPSDPHQPGPIFFLTPHKCAIFGICCEAVPRQVMYLIDEAFNVGKGANSIISMLHHFLKCMDLGKNTYIFMQTIVLDRTRTDF